MNGMAMSMGAFMLAVATLTTSAKAVVMVDLPNACADRNALMGIAMDAQLNAVKLYYEGYIGAVDDPARRSCLTTQVLRDDRFVVINKTRQLVVGDCMPIGEAAGAALSGLCR